MINSMSVIMFLSLSCISHARVKPPNIIFILVDDLGWNDVSFHGSPEIPTPNIDALAASGIVLQNHYVQPMCTPSRGALMTGKYPLYFGLQHNVILDAAPNALPLNIKILPQYLKDLGYSTHGVGKWHLGYYKKVYTPTYRGFDTYFGYWNGKIDYYDFTDYATVSNVEGINSVWGIDLHNGTESIKHMRGRYATDVFTESATDIIAKHDKRKPLFLYISHLACHNGNAYQQMQAPYEHVAKFSYIENMERRTFAGILSKLDESVGKVFEALHEKGMLRNTIIVFSSDNGGDPSGKRGERSNNWPLRSAKSHLWEGGVRVPALIWSPLLNLKQPRVSRQMMHISDWLPTLYRAAGGDPKELGKINGIDMWSHLLRNKPSPRNEILLNVDPIYGMSALIRGHYKLIWGSHPDGRNSWYGTSGREYLKTKSMDDWVWKEGCIVKNTLEKLGLWLLKVPDEWRADLAVNCGKCHDFRLEYCDLKQPCLYNLTRDPCEYENVASLYPELVQSMLKRLEEYNSTAVPPLQAPVDPHGDPRCHDFLYVPWLDDEYKSDCPYFEKYEGQ